MRVIKSILFLLALMVMVGHDIVPHHHDDDDNDLIEHSATIPPLTNNGLSNLQNAFSHFQHSTAEQHLVYLTGTEKKVSFSTDHFYWLPYFVPIESHLFWYANYKKQRFWECDDKTSSYQVNSHALRGPPLC